MNLRNRYLEVLSNVDHHVSNTNLVEHNFVLSDASATGEILQNSFSIRIMRLIKPLRGSLSWICTDTGQFCYSGTNASVFEICRKLVTQECNPANVAHELYEKKT